MKPWDHSLCSHSKCPAPKTTRHARRCRRRVKRRIAYWFNDDRRHWPSSEILKRLASQYSKIDVYILPGISVDLYEKVLQGEIDIAFIVEPAFQLQRICDWQIVREEPLLLIAPPPLADEDPHMLLAREPFIQYDRSTWGGRLVEDYLKVADVTPRTKFELDSLEAIASMVGEGLGVAIVPNWAPPWPENLNIAKIALPIEFRRRILLVWTRTSPRLNLIKAFLQIM